MTSVSEHLVRCGAVRFGQFTLTSGQQSNYYVDVKAAMTDPTVLRPIAEAMAKMAAERGPFDAVAGMELGAVPIATAVSLAANLPLLVVRKGERNHGTGKRIEGSDPAGLHVYVVEDVTTTGGSTVECIEVLRAAGAKVTLASSVVDRESGATAKFEAMDVQLIPLVTASQLLATPQAKAALAEVAG
jgi:orotate phosphoribosyltransferase